MTPEEARELLIQVKCEQNTHKGYRDALHLVSGLRYEYAYQVKLPDDDRWLWVSSEGRYTAYEPLAIRNTNRDVVRIEAAVEKHPTRMFRRLVSDTEET